MPIGLAAVAAGAAVASAASGIAGSLKAADAQKKAAEQTAKLNYNARMEELRNKQIRDAQTLGLAVSTSFANNVQRTGTPKKYIDVLRSEQLRGDAMLRNFAAKERELTLESGKTPALGAQILGQAASGLSSAISGYKGAL